MEIRWKSDKDRYAEYIKRRKAIVAELKKRAKPEKLSRAEIERWMKNNQTLQGDMYVWMV